MSSSKSDQVYYVSPNGSDSNPGSEQSPFRTIQRAADIMQQGDTCIVREGVYREWVKPPRGGASESARITYTAAQGEHVVIKGSEQINSWVKVKDNVWRVIFPDSYFGSFNPYKANVSGGWLKFGGEYHLGEVHFNEEALWEKLSLDEVTVQPNTWYTEGAGTDETIIYANFNGADPNKGLAEINVRECVFFPTVKGLKYITVDGFHMMHSSANWACFLHFQRAMLGTYWGMYWIMQNCTLSYAKCAGIVCGNDDSGINESFDVESTGHHIVRNNIIRKCGQAGIVGYKGWCVSLIENNLIEEINYKREFGGFETGGMKLHHAIDITVKNNVVRKVYRSPVGDYVGIWIDWAAQGTRITGNVVYDMEAMAMFVQFFHGAPFLVDNNVFSGTVAHTSENITFAHNMFINSPWHFDISLTKRNGDPYDPGYWLPHTGTFVKTLPVSFRNDRYYNNIFSGIGAEQIINAPDYKSDYNVFYQGAHKTGWGDGHSIEDSSVTSGVAIKSLENGVEIALNVNNSPYDVKCPLITREFIGTYALTGQALEKHDGSPITINRDLNGNERDTVHPAAGPFEKLQEGVNTFRLIVGPRR